MFSGKYRTDGPKKNKMNMEKSNNEKIKMREFEDADIFRNRQSKAMDIDRIMLERKIITDNRSDLDISERSIYNDFELFNKPEDTNNNITENSDNNDDYADINETMKRISDTFDPFERCVSDANTTTLWLHSNMYKLTEGDYIINGFGLFSAFGTLYLISNNDLELKNYFGFQDKKYLNAGLLTMREKLNVWREQVVIDNYIINDHSITSSKNIANGLKKLIFNVVINNEYPDKECDRVNRLINKISGMNNVISSNTLSNTKMSIIMIAKIRPIWKYKIDNIVKARFNGEVRDFIRFTDKTFNYYEDVERQLIEVPLKGELTVGFILPKKREQESAFDLKSLTTAINYIKPTILNDVQIPMINKRYKMRLMKTLQKTGLKYVFSNNNKYTLYPEGCMINDCIEYIDIIFDKRSMNMNNSSGCRTSRKFIANRTFEFYLRDVENNCIIIMGRSG